LVGDRQEGVPETSLVVSDVKRHLSVPMSIDADDRGVESVHVAKVFVSDYDTSAIRNDFHNFNKGIEVRRRLVVDGLNQPTKLATFEPEGTTGFAAVHTVVLESDGIEAGLLVGELVEKGTSS
jgi:hypothetical protein